MSPFNNESSKAKEMSEWWSRDTNPGLLNSSPSPWPPHCAYAAAPFRHFPSHCHSAVTACTVRILIQYLYHHSVLPRLQKLLSQVRGEAQGDPEAASSFWNWD